jgi:hypothetical protein
MPCPSITSGVRTDNAPFTNWSGRIVAAPTNALFEPSSLGDLVNMLQQAAAEGRRVRAVGSRWSFEEIAYSPDWMVSLTSLNRPLTNIIPAALTAEWANRTDGEALLHVEAGATIADINDHLAGAGLALPTMGGSNGQTIGGAISTSTHGSDFDFQPFPDLILALHIVADGGQEYWVERESHPITDDFRLANALTCPDARIVRNNQLFNAMIVGMGRFGVLYSVVVSVRSAFRLAEWAVRLPTPQVLGLLRTGVSTTFLKPLIDVLPPPPTDLEAENVSQPRYLDVTFDSLNTDTCFVRRRWTTTRTSDLNNADEPDMLCALGAGGVKNIVQTVLLALGPFATPVTGPVIAMLEIALAQNPNMTAGDMVALSLSHIWNIPILSNAIPAIAQQIFGSRLGPSLNQGRVGRSDLIMSSYRQQNQQACFRAVSIEPAFDAHQPGYLDFVQTLIEPSKSTRQSGYWSIRWSTRSTATLSMHNVTSGHAVAVEVTSLKGLPDNEAWISFVEAMALSAGGRPHWGQQHRLADFQLATVYGNNLDEWRAALSDFGTSNTFSTPYTVRTGLEPIPGRVPNPAMQGRLASDLRQQTIVTDVVRRPRNLPLGRPIPQ